MATISDLELYIVDDAASPPPAGRTLLVNLLTDAGTSGWGEAPTAWLASELPGRRQMLLANLAGRSIYDLEELARLEVLRDTTLRAAIDMACWDLLGRTVGEPLCRLLGGEYRQHLPLAVRLQSSSVDNIEQVARELAEQGFHTQLLSLARGAVRPMERVAAARAGAGTRGRLRIDAAGSLDYQSAEDLCARCHALELEYLLDPLDASDLQQTATLARLSPVPIAVSRAIRSPADVWRITRASERLHLVLDIARLGGISSVRRAVAVAEAAGMTVSLSASTSLGVALAAMLHLAAATPALHRPGQTTLPCQHDVLAEPLSAHDGLVQVPRSPGLGVMVDRARLDALVSH